MNKRLYLILGLAFVLRAWGAWFGPYHPDEPLVINQALSFGAGNPFSFIHYYYPPVFQYILFFAYAVFYVMGWVLGFFRNFDNFLFLVVIKQFPFYLIGRLIVALMGAATVLPVYLIVKKLRSEKAALLAALFMSCTFLHVRNSHYCTVDIPMTFMVALSYLYILKIVEDDRIINYILAGAISGVAIATKYNAGILIPCIVVAGLTHFTSREDVVMSIKKIVAGLISAAAVFFIFCSYSIWDHSNFMKDLHILCATGTTKNVPLWYRFKVDLYYGLGLPLEILGVLGFGYLAFRYKKMGIVLAAFPFFYFLSLAKIGQWFSRYSLPVTPFFAISAGIFLYDMLTDKTSKFKFKKQIIYLCVIMVVASPLIRSVYADYLLSKPDIRDLAEDWVHKNIRQGSKIAIDNPQHSPHLFPTMGQLKEKTGYLADVKGKHLRKKRIEMMMNLKNYPDENYELYYLGTLLAEFSLHTPAVPHDRKSIFDNDIEYIIASDLNIERYGDFYDSLKSDLILLKDFSPFREKDKAHYSSHPYSYMPIDDTLFDLSNNGIGIKIYKVKR